MQAHSDDDSMHKWHKVASLCAEFSPACSRDWLNSSSRAEELTQHFSGTHQLAYGRGPLPRLWVVRRFCTSLRG
jgi:hypothetical protein